MEFLADYGLFLLKAVTIVVAIGLVVGLIASAGQKQKSNLPKLINLNKKLSKVKEHFEDQTIDKKVLKKKRKESKKEEKSEKADKPICYVMDFHGDIKASQVEQFKHDVTALISLEQDIDEVIVRLESGGGMVHQYGYAAAQIERLRAKGIRVTVCVDRVAASGGYMMACVADQVVAAPFAVLGSIGVIAQVPNVHRLLKKNDIDFEVHTAGEYKRTLTVFGENTDKAREKFKDDLNEVHVMFKEFVSKYRPELDVVKVANGDVWYGNQAKEMGLIDRIETSDGYLLESSLTKTLIQIKHEPKKTVAKKLGLGAQAALEKAGENLIEKLAHKRWFV